MRTVASMDAYGPGRCALAMGKFDGVHRGHQSVLTEAVRIARQRGIESVALTFDRNPLALIDPDRAPEDIAPLARKRALIAEMGVGCLVVCHFTRALMEMEPEDFLRELASKLHPEVIVCGENFNFGRGARGNAQMLRRMAGELGFEAAIVPLCEVDGAPASSTRVRTLINEGDLGAAERLLGRPYQDTAQG